MLPWCQAACADGEWSWCALDLDAVIAIDAQARRLVKLRPERTDTWSSLADGGGRGDCDNLTSTVLDLLARAGAPPPMLGRALVQTHRGEKGSNHQIGLVKIDGAFFVVGDTQGPVRPLADVDYELVWMQTLNQGLKWRLIP